MTQPQPRRRRKKRSKKFKAFIAFLLFGAIGAVVYFNMKKETPTETFATLPVESGELVDKLAETGSIELVRTVEVKSTIAGEIRQLLIEAGDWVKEGQLMAIIEPDPNQSLQLYQKRSAVERYRTDLAEQQRDFARKKTLYDNKMIPSKDFEDAEMRLERATQNLRLAELELEILETKANLTRAERQEAAGELDEIRVLAPIGGIVIRRGVEIGEVVASGLSSYSGGTLLFQIGDPSQMIVRGDIAEIDIGKLRVGQEVEIVVDAYPDTTYRGQVRWIAPVGEKKQGSSIVTFDTEIDILDREPRLRQGMSCDIDIIFTRRDSTLFLPVEAVQELFEDEKAGEEVKGKRGRFVCYAVRPADSTATDSTAVLADSTSADSTTVAAADTSMADATSSAASADSALVADPADTLATLTDSTHLDSLAADSTATDTTAADSAKPPPTRFPLADFVEVELEIGLETSTRIEILSGLEPDERVAADPALIRRKKEEQAKNPQPEKKGWF